MKVAIISDSHFGVKKSNPIFLKSQLRFFDECFIPYLEKHKINTIFHLGDVYDNRHNINVGVLNEFDSLIFEKLRGYLICILVGNHDTYFKNTIDIHSLKPYNKFPNINIVDEIKMERFDNRDILLVPWQVDNNVFIKKIADKNVKDLDVCMGHFEINGFNMNNTKVCDQGIDPSIFIKNYHLTLSGHFHQRKIINQGNRAIHYIGNPYQLTRSDINQKKGFAVLDLDTLEIEYIDNNVSIQYKRLKYPDYFEKKDIKGNVVDVIVDVSEDIDEKDYQKYLSEIESFEPAFTPELKLENNVNTTSNGSYNIQTTEELIEEYVNDIDDLSEDKKENICNKLLDLYKQCRKED